MIFRKILKYHILLNLSIRIRLVPYGWTDTTKLIVAFLYFEKAPKMHEITDNLAP